MFTSSYNDKNYGIDPLTYSDQPRPFLNDILTSSSSSTTSNQNHDDPPPFSNFFYLPSPLFPPYSGVLMDLEDQTLLLQEEHENGLNLQDGPTMTTSACNDSISAREDQQQQLMAYHELVRANEKVPLMRRSSKRDRHSKINTAQGPRDRRMRLSLKVAREFFDVQDMLGFDKASKTVEWLLVQSKSSTEKLFAEVPGQMTMNYSCKRASSSLSECEVISGLDEAALVTRFSPKGSSKTSPSGKKKLRRTISSSQRKPAVLQPLARAKARARARERTLEKKWIRRLDGSKLSEEATNHGLNQNQSGSCWSSAFATGEEHSSSCKQTFNRNMNPPPLPPPSLDGLSEANAWIHQKQERLQAATGCFIDDSLVIMSKWSPSSILMSHPQSTSNIPQELQIRDFQSVFKD